MIPIRDGIEVFHSGDIRIYLPDAAINDSDAKEFQSNKRFESEISYQQDGEIIFNDFLRKSDFIRTYLECAHFLELKPDSCVLELGADHGWASVIAKANCPQSYIVGSDLVPDCIRHASRYERLLQASLDEKWAFSVRDIPFEDEQFDCIFTFAAFHHFGDHCNYELSMREMARVLKIGCRIVLLYEPSSPRFFHKVAFARANRNREYEAVDEDVIVPRRLKALCRSIGLECQQSPFPIFRYRPSVLSTVYYFILSKAGYLTRIVPCTYNYVLTKERTTTW
jgi:ubiquinone/menaquinone biosynthesis C-methylase UbiE